MRIKDRPGLCSVSLGDAKSLDQHCPTETQGQPHTEFYISHITALKQTSEINFNNILNAIFPNYHFTVINIKKLLIVHILFLYQVFKTHCILYSWHNSIWTKPHFKSSISDNPSLDLSLTEFIDWLGDEISPLPQNLYSFGKERSVRPLTQQSDGRGLAGGLLPQGIHNYSRDTCFEGADVNSHCFS